VRGRGRLHRRNPGVPGLCPRGEGQSEMAPGSGRSCINTTAVPDAALIETALAGGTVAREIFCAGLAEHRTRAAGSALEFTKGCVWGAAGSENLPAAWQGWCSGRKERLRANPQTMDRDTNRRCDQQSRHKRRTKHRTPHHAHRPQLVGSAPQAPRDLSHSGQSRRVRQKRGTADKSAGAPSPVLAPGAALGSRLRVALSSGEVIDHSIRNHCGLGIGARAALKKQQPNS